MVQRKGLAEHDQRMVGKRLIALREARDWKQITFAKMLGVSAQRLNNWENGNNLIRIEWAIRALAAAAYHAGPGRVAAWLSSHQPLPDETRSYVVIITCWTADEWASANPPKTSETTIPQGVPCTRLANRILAPKEQAQRMAAYVPRWGMQLTADWSESEAWAKYRLIQKQYAALIGDREPIVVRSRGIGMGSD